MRGTPRNRHPLRATILAVVTSLSAAAPVSSAAAAVIAQPGTTTTSTLAPTTTTTVPPTTTTSVPPTTTTSHPSTTTTVPVTTTTIHHAANTSSNTPWGLIALVIALVIAIVLVALLMRSRTRRAREAEWRRSVVPAMSDAQLARESLLSPNATAEDPELRGAVSVQVERAAAALSAAAGSAPDEDAAGMAGSAAGSLRGLAFAVEADRLLRHGAAAPSGLQLAEADQARRDRTNELNTALARLSARVGPVPPGPTRRP